MRLWPLLLLVCGMAYGQTPTPTPGPCDHCPDPTSWSCQLWPHTCYPCWEDCGQPLATPTPTNTPTPTATPTPTQTPTPVGPPCVLHAIGPGVVNLVAVWAHEDKNCIRYIYQVLPRDVPAGSYRFDPTAEGTPVGYEWHDVNSGEIIKSCGDTGRDYVCTDIFEDGFESGNTSRWN